MGLSEEELEPEIKESFQSCIFGSYTTEDVMYLYTAFPNSKMAKAHFDSFVEVAKESVISESSATVKNYSFWQAVDSTNYILAYYVDEVEILGMCKKEKKDEVRDNVRGMLSKDYSNIDVPVHKAKEVEDDIEENENQKSHNEFIEENKTSEEIQKQYKFIMLEGTEEVPVYINNIGVEGLEYSESEYTLSVNATSKYNVMYSDSYIKIDDLDEIKDTEKMLYTEGTLEEVIIGNRKGYIMHKETDYVKFVCVLQDVGLDSYVKISMTVYDKNIEIDDMVQRFTLDIK